MGITKLGSKKIEQMRNLDFAKMYLKIFPGSSKYFIWLNLLAAQTSHN